MGSRDGTGDISEAQGYAADIDSIREAQARIAPYVHRTPVMSSTSIDAMVGKKLFFKCECFQKAGAFKIRGASNSIFALDDEQVSKGVVTHSRCDISRTESGNHAAAVALAAKLRGIPAHIVIPRNAPACKVENVKRYGGHIIWSDASIESRESVCKRVQEETGAVLIHPFNSGGLISGVALAAKAINPSIRILAAEPKGADDSAQSKAAGKIITLPSTNTIADGLRAFLGDLTWPVVRDLVDDVIVVDDTAIVDAMKMCYEILKVAVEPSGAIGLAAALSDEFKQSSAWHESSKIGIIVSGGNVDLGTLWQSMYKH
ncbi:Serine racemase [Zea mays]|uniref:Serine racemase n=1 Tax=Zea mays TaxID=4577 RepID=A0A3L6FZJ7_MAIZE|nr:Serine racemase [Zea mays]